MGKVHYIEEVNIHSRKSALPFLDYESAKEVLNHVSVDFSHARNIPSKPSHTEKSIKFTPNSNSSHPASAPSYTAAHCP